MVIAPLLPNESNRVLALDSYQLLDTLPEEEFDEIAKLAASLCQAPIALVSLVDSRRQWFKAKVGLDICETGRNVAFCTHAMAAGGKEPLIIPDTRHDVRFHDNPLVTGSPKIVFYAGIPLVNEAGYVLGSLCVIDQQPRSLNRQQIDGLKILAGMILQKMEARKEKLAFRNGENSQAQEFRLLPQAANASSDPLYIVDPASLKFLDFNEPALEQLGYSKKELLEKGLLALTPGLKREELHAVLQKVIKEKKKGYLLKTRHQKKEGERFPVEILLSYSEEQAGLVMAAVRYVAAKKEAEQKLMEKKAALINGEQELKALMESAPLLMVKTNGLLQIAYANDPEANAVGESVLSLFPAKVRETTEQQLRKAMLSGQLVNFQFEQEDTARRMWYNVQVKRINHLEGSGSLLLLIEDVTQARELELEKDQLLQELRVRVNALQQYNYIVSHNLRGPVANILGLVNLLQNMPEHLSEEEKSLYLRKLYEATFKMDSIIQDLTHMLAIRSPKEEKKDAIDFREMIAGTISSLQTFIDEAQADIQVWVDPQLGSFTSIRSYVQSILYNLISNAIKYRALNRRLQVSVKVNRQAGKLVLEVADNGQGINLQKYGQQLFGLYKRFNLYVEGKGLGLHMTKAQVDALGGTIAVSSIEGRGATFTVNFESEADTVPETDATKKLWVGKACQA